MVIAKNPDDLVPVYEKSDVESAVVAKLERGVVGTVKRCTDGWCAIKGSGYDGFVQQVRLWGVYPNEKVD
jgi:SH3-like domain-containing protein